MAVNVYVNADLHLIASSLNEKAVYCSNIYFVELDQKLNQLTVYCRRGTVVYVLDHMPIEETEAIIDEISASWVVDLQEIPEEVEEANGVGSKAMMAPLLADSRLSPLSHIKRKLSCNVQRRLHINHAAHEVA